VACSAPGGEDIEVRWLDYDLFVADVQPILAEKCGNPSCHGRADRPYSVFSPRAWRLDPERTHLSEPLSSEELVHNYTMSCVFVSEAEAPDASLLLLKPLGSSGDVFHGGGVIFEGESDRDYRIVLEWIEKGWSQ
jgi:hypothetical protein